MHIRKIEKNDYNKNYINLLSQLTVVGNITQYQFNNFIDILNDDHQIWVIEINNQIIATGTIVKEQKLIHNCGKVGHIEEIVVDNNYRNLQLGQKIVEHLINCSTDCYKINLTCNEKLEKFYNKCELTKTGLTMSKYNLKSY